MPQFMAIPIQVEMIINLLGRLVSGIIVFIEKNGIGDQGLVWFVGFYGISTFVGYLMPNPFLCELSVLFKTIQLSISTQFVKNISISNYSSSYM